ncbi:hypothetical protein CPB84DRAFT_1692558 [Gymnopilus junonius]|uniref:Uncharacterized protein n=1 Tax=Gymnopilus junonius TaxID=109634 RepID=A0A9P5N716_GYMJU|nr:hypothetical protein CPB84DRAFT_1692558 [Gymnopilus junonius]
MPPVLPKAPVVPPHTAASNLPTAIPQEPTEDNPMFKTDPDEFGIYRVYPRKPYHQPDVSSTLDDICEGDARPSTEHDSRHWWKGFNPGMETPSADNPFSPLSNETSFQILNWHYNGSRQKSQAELTSLLDDVIKADNFNLEDTWNFNYAQETSLLDSADDPAAPFANEHIWHEATIKIPLPCAGHKFASEDKAHHLRIRGIHYRKIPEVMHAAAKDESAKSWQNIPFKMYWQQMPESTPQCIISELYTADKYLEEDMKIAKLPLVLLTDPPDLKPVENAVFAIMLWSDSTHLADFGDASMWLVYFFPGMQSKYPRGRPTQHAAHHIAHIPPVFISLLLKSLN